MATFSLNSLPLEGDGVLENLFHYLWYKDELDNGPKINIPDTIIYKFRQPAYWYFTAKNGQIKKKSRYNLANIRIEEVFTRRVLGSDIIAYYLSTNSETGKTTIEYFDRESLRDFLYNREKVNNGILQRFIEPKGTKNMMIRGVWSPKILLLERRENNQHLTDMKYSLYERAVTYEGAEHFSRASPVRGSILPLTVQEVCKQVVDHVSDVSFRKCNISRMALNFKVDGEDRIWLLWCTSLRLEQTISARTIAEMKTNESLNSSGVDLSVAVPMKMRLPSKQGPVSLFAHCEVPESVQQAFQTTKAIRSPTHKAGFMKEDPDSATNVQPSGKNLVPVDSLECRSCCSFVLGDRFYKVQYKTIVTHFEQFMAVLAANTGEEMQIEWPPNPKIIDAVGRVGLGPLERLRASLLAAKDRSKVTIAAEDIEIPPIIRDLHPHLCAQDYRRFRKDPMFLYKSCSVCEDCYLVFAQVNSIGGSTEEAVSGINEVNGSPTSSRRQSQRLKQKNERAMDEHIERATRLRKQKKLERKREREWRKRAQEFHQRQSKDDLAFHPLSKTSGPELPPRIDDRNISTLAITMSQPVLQTQIQYQKEMEEKRRDASEEKQGGREEKTSGVVPDDFKHELRERENAFFRDLYRNPNLQHGHPLSHMISTQAKLSISASGTTSNTSSLPTKRKPTNLNPLLHRPTSSKKANGKTTFKSMLSPRELEAIDFSSPYAQTQVLPIKPISGKMHTTKKPSTAKSNSERESKHDIDHQDDTTENPSQSGVLEPVDATKHREFLMATLQRVQDQLANPMPLEQAVGLDRAADVMGKSAEEGKSMDRAWEMRERTLAATPSDLGRILRTGITISGQHLMAAVDLNKEEFIITIYNPTLALTQKIQLPMSTVLQHAPKEEAEDSEALARYILAHLEEDEHSELFPESICLKVNFQPQQQ